MPRIAYIMSRFPKITETFILYEILEQEKLGLSIEIYPLLREREPVVHPEAAELVKRVHYQPFLSWPILQANWRFLRQDARTYLRMLADVARGTLGSLNFFVGALCILPKSVYFAQEMKLQGVAHVHAHFATHPTVTALIIWRLTGIPFSFTAHGHDIHVDRRMLGAKVAEAQFVAAISRYNQELVVRECGERFREKVHVVHCGVSAEVFAGGRRCRSAGEPLRIVCVASLEEVKGHRYLIEACRLLRERGVSFECHLLGDGPQRDDLQRRIKSSGLAGLVNLHGAAPRPHVVDCLQRSDVMVLASVPVNCGKREGIPVALMEGMASGLAVISSAISGIPELVEHAISGFLTAPGDSNAIASALERIAADPELADRMGQAAQRKVREEFDLRRNTARLAALFTGDHSSFPASSTQLPDAAAASSMAAD